MRDATRVLLAGTVAIAGWIGWGVYATRTAKPVPYERVRTVDGVELRRYPETVVVETTAPNQRTAFMRLFSYISGSNRGGESVSMTAPVETRGASVSMTTPVRTEAGNERMAFYLPPEYGPETAPEPTESGVELRAEPAKTVATVRFSWYAPEWRQKRYARKLLSVLEEAAIDTVGDPYLLRYNDPWTPPFMRRNEVAVEVADPG